MRQIVTVLLIAGPHSGRQVVLGTKGMDPLPPRLTVREQPQHLLHEYTYSGRNVQKQHTYTYNKTL